MTDSTVGGPEADKSPIRRFFEMEPAILRGLLVALAAIVAQVVKSGVDLNEWVDLIINLFTALGAILASWWTRTVVVPTAKVLAFKQPTGEIVSGGATIAATDEQIDATVEAALKEAA